MYNRLIEMAAEEAYQENQKAFGIASLFSDGVTPTTADLKQLEQHMKKVDEWLWALKNR